MKTAPAQITQTGETGSNAWFEIILHEGRNQQIRRMFDSVGHSVVKLRRVRIGDITDEQLRPGEFRTLAPQEVARLMGKGRGKTRAAKAGATTTTAAAVKTASKGRPRR